MGDGLKVAVLVVVQGFDMGYRSPTDFTIDDYRGGRAPHWDREGDTSEGDRYGKYCRIILSLKGDTCPLGYVRYIAGVDGKLRKLDENIDSSG
jgi:hypothetical protein